jgi:hypothetical protein
MKTILEYGFCEFNDSVLTRTATKKGCFPEKAKDKREYIFAVPGAIFRWWGLKSM